jgi:long-chain fatty acid transport protein
MRGVTFTLAIGLVCIFAALAKAPPALATNGDNLISVGPVSRSMGGVAIASPQDAVSAVFANPAAMCFSPFCPSEQVDASVDLFIPKVETRVSNSFGAFEADSEDKIYPIPAIGASFAMEKNPRLRIGVAAFGVSGLGVDYEDTEVDGADPTPLGPLPRAAGTFTELSRAKFAPAISYQLTPNISVGFSLHLHYATLEISEDSEGDWTVGVQPGIIYKPSDSVSIGATYITSQGLTHENVTDFDGDGSLDDLDLEAPRVFGIGVAWEPIYQELLFAFDTRYINWADANGYREFDWDNQWTFGVGGQWKPLDWLTLRAGYNYGKNPVNDHDGWVGSQPIEVQGKMLPTYFYETFRIVGFPAIVEHHATFGAGFKVSEKFRIDTSYVRAFSNSIEETGTDLLGNPATVESELSENTFGIGFSYTW